jgi:predicted TIM-barrel fold metal-dependent hydrolase
MTWTDVSVCYRHPEWKAQSEETTLLAAMDAADIGRAWVYGYEAVATHNFAQANRDIKALADAHPERFVPIGLVNPFHAFPAADELMDQGFKSIKILTGWGNWLTIENVRLSVIPIARRLKERSLHLSLALEGNVPVTGGSTFLPYLVREACPDVCMVLDHCWLPDAWKDYLVLAEDDPALWFTLHALPQALLTHVVGSLGVERILLGSWLPETDPDLVYTQIKRAAGVGDRIDEILTENAARALAGQPPQRRRL